MLYRIIYGFDLEGLQVLVQDLINEGLATDVKWTPHAAPFLVPEVGFYQVMLGTITSLRKFETNQR